MVKLVNKVTTRTNFYSKCFIDEICLLLTAVIILQCLQEEGNRGWDRYRLFEQVWERGSLYKEVQWNFCDYIWTSQHCFYFIYFNRWFLFEVTQNWHKIRDTSSSPSLSLGFSDYYIKVLLRKLVNSLSIVNVILNQCLRGIRHRCYFSATKATEQLSLIGC